MIELCYCPLVIMRIYSISYGSTTVSYNRILWVQESNTIDRSGSRTGIYYILILDAHTKFYRSKSWAMEICVFASVRITDLVEEQVYSIAKDASKLWIHWKEQKVLRFSVNVVSIDNMQSLGIQTHQWSKTNEKCTKFTNWAIELIQKL